MFSNIFVYVFIGFSLLGYASPREVEAFTQSSVFTPPSAKQQYLQSDFEESFTRTLELRKITPLSSKQKSLLSNIVDNEVVGFVGYHGDSLDYYIYQDIIRYVMEEIVGVSLRPDFHFLAVPLDPLQSIQTKSQLLQVYEDRKHNISIPLSESTFPLNFTLWDNLDRLGLNTLEHYNNNESVKPLGYARRLKWLFQRLGVQENEIAKLFALAKDQLSSSKGVILQIFDTSFKPYEFTKKTAFPAYPNGFMAANKTVDEYFMDDSFVPPYPHEIRLLLNNRETLNPDSPLKIIRHTPEISTETLKKYQINLRNKIKILTYSQSKKNSYLQELKAIWLPTSKP